MTTACHMIPMMMSSSVAIILIMIIVLFALAGYALVRVGDKDDSPQCKDAEEMRKLSEEYSSNDFDEILDTIRWGVEQCAKMGLRDYYKNTGFSYCNDGTMRYLSVSTLKQIGAIMEDDGFNVEYVDENTIRVSW